MCGIIGYTGLAEATPFLVQGLLQLQYRGYDSAGLATLAPAHIERRRVLGSPEGLVPLLGQKPLVGTTGIGHTRWATHGKASVANAHPHLSQNGRIAVVHNGTIENYSALRVELQYQGYVFASQTDTEVVAHMVEQELRSQKSLAAAVAAVLPRLRGTYALAVISVDSPGEIVVARLSSPLLLGFGQGGVLISSDEVGFSGHVSSVLALRDGDIATVRADGSYLLEGVSADAMAERISPATISLEEIGKGAHSCFMMKEICEQPGAMQDTLRGRILPDYTGVKLGGVDKVAGRLTHTQRIIFLACGTSYHAALVGKQLIEGLARIPVEVAFASEFMHTDPLIDSQDVAIGISQSGATFDTLRAMELAKRCGALTLGITNRVGSELASMTDAGIYLHVGPEIAVASTKAFTGQVAVLTLLAVHLASLRGVAKPMQVEPLLRGLDMMMQWMSSALYMHKQIEDIVAAYVNARQVLFIGRGVNAPLALEGALKLKEVAYVNAHAHPAGELKHGPLSLIEEGTPVIAIAPQDALQEAMFSAIEEAKARGAHIILLGTQGDARAEALSHHYIGLPKVPMELFPILGALPLQLLAYAWGVAKGCNVDRPRNLAKSVTVG